MLKLYYKGVNKNNCEGFFAIKGYKVAISAVSSVSFRNNYIQFEGRKKGKKSNDGAQHRHSSTPMKAVPLAVMLAMSPLNNAQAQINQQVFPTISITKTHPQALKDPRVVDSDSFDMGKGFYSDNPELYLYYLNTDNNRSNVEQVEAISDETSAKISVWGEMDFNDIYGVVKGLNNCNYNIVGDDGKSIGVWSFSYATVTSTDGSGSYIMRPDIVNSVKEFASSSKNNGAIDVRTINKDAVVGRLGMSTARSIDLSWIDEVRKNNYNFGTKLKEFNWETDNGAYNVSLYSSDGNDNDCETIIIERSDGLKCKLDGLRELKVQIVSPDFYNGEYAEIGCIDVSWPNVGKYTILDSDVYNALKEIKQKYPNVGKAYSVCNQKNYVELSSGGNILKH